MRRSVGVVKDKGAGRQLIEGPTKTGQSRVVDLDAGTVAALRTHREARGLVTPDPVRDSALVLSELDGTHRHPERFSRPLHRPARASAQGAGGGPPAGDPAARPPPHSRDAVLADGVPVRVVSERLGHASAMITLAVYQHVHPGMGRQAADPFAALLDG